jgi:signal transduction histidine kinase
MLGTINDIINISKIEAGIMSVQITKIDLASVVNEITGMFRPEAEKKGIHIVSELPGINDKTTIESDYEKVFAIFTNLVKNAIKYSNHGTITVGYVSAPANVECYVKDTGIGISQDIQSAIFERFTRAEVHSRRSVEGAGLGLSIVKGYLQMLGGSIYLQSEPGEGSKFTFELPKVLK